MAKIESGYAKIRSLYFPLSNYKYDHGPTSEERNNDKFLGRKKILNRLVTVLDPDNSKQKNGGNGAYLVTGYRGMGKTSLVREAIHRINKPNSSDKDTEKVLIAENDCNKINFKNAETSRDKGLNNSKTPNQSANNDKQHKKIEYFWFSLSQDDVLEFELLRQIAWELHRWVADQHKILKLAKSSRLKNRFLAVLIALFIALPIVNIPQFIGVNWWTTPFELNTSGGVFLFFGILFFLTVFIEHCINYYWEERTAKNKLDPNKKKTKLRRRIYARALIQLNQELSDRIFSSAIKEDLPLRSVNSDGNTIESQLGGKFLDIVNGKRNQKVTQSFEKASTKEIEQYLYRILKEIDNLRSTYDLRAKNNLKSIDDIIPPFVFVVDELDKVEPDYYFTPGDRESDLYGNNTMPFDVMTKARKRNEAISKLLANLKNFLNNSNAKFVFIGGRGMYDAALADIADRESFYSSIFNEVIYVPNFFKDKLSNQAGLTQMTESYLCRLLIEGIYPKIELDDECYGLQVLKNAYFEKFEMLANHEEKIFKFLHTLQNLIVYLTYRSNGSPKKLIELIESYIIVFTKPEDISKAKSNGFFFEDYSEFVPKNHSNSNNSNDVKSKGATEKVETEAFYLKIGGIQQYEINLHSNLYRPYISLNSRHLKFLGDKLLYSTAFLVDHILKFHKAAFSWRNLEHLPDIILSNKDPNFRKFYSDIMNDLTKQHLRKTINAIFQYKFNSKIQNELKFVSKISENSAAAFNFTLDESFHLKSYYKRKLAAKYREYEMLTKDSGEAEYIYNIGYLHCAIADIHYYDEEYDDAILHYSDSLQILKSSKNARRSAMFSHYNVLFIRNSLSLGLCFEKAKMYERAYSVYRSLLMDFRQMTSVRNLQVIDKLGDWNFILKSMQLYQRPHIALLNVIEKDRQDGITFDNLLKNQMEYFTFLGIEHPEKYFPNTIKTIQYDDLKKAASDFRDRKRTMTLVSDYYYSIAGILFYKNHIFYGFLYKQDNIAEDELISSLIKKQLQDKTGYYHPAQSAYLYYLHSLTSFNTPYVENINSLWEKGNRKITKIEEQKEGMLLAHLKFVLNYLEPSIYKILNSAQFDFLGNILAKLGDSILASIKKPTSLRGLGPYIELYTEQGLNDMDKKTVSEFTMGQALDLKIVFLLYRMSYHCYNRAAKKYSAIFQYKKMLYALKENISSMPNSSFTLNLEKLDCVFEIMLKSQTDISRVSNRNQLAKYRKQTDSNYIDTFYTNLLYNNLSTAPEVKEIILLRESFRTKIDRNYQSNLYIGEYSTISNVFTRTLELKFKGDQEMAVIKQDGKHISWVDEKVFNTNVNRLVNAIYCYHEMMKTIKTYGIGYILNHSYMAAICTRMAIACDYYETYDNLANSYNDMAKRNNENENKGMDIELLLSPREELNCLIGKGIVHVVDKFEYYDLARLHFKEAIELHSEGNSYKEASKEMYTLDDDYNDNLKHYCASMEKFRINIGRIKNNIDRLRELLKDSQLYNIENYMSDEIEAV